MQWLRPSLVAEVAFTERTNEGILRQASFMGLRQDLPAKNVHQERAVPPPAAAKADVTKAVTKAAAKADPNTVMGVKITHPDRVVWPKLGITKIELARYVEDVGEWLLPHVRTGRFRSCAAPTAPRASASTSATS